MAMIAARRLQMFDLWPVIQKAEPAINRHSAEMHLAGRYILGEQVRLFETELARAFGAPYAVGTGSGFAALELCLRAAGIVHPEQEVIVPAMTSLFTAQAVLAAGASLRIADIDSDTMLLSPDSVRSAWTSRTAAVLCVHLYGNVCRLDELADLCASRGAVLIQDACQAHGAMYRGEPLTAFSPYTAYSFYPTKNLGCLGDGGAVVTDSARVARRVRLLRDGGRDSDQIARAPGINSRLDELHACYLRAFLPHLAWWTNHRKKNAQMYDRMLKTRGEIRLTAYSQESAHHLYVIRTSNRDRLRKVLAGEEIETGIHYPVPLHRQPAFRRRASWHAVPVEAEKASGTVLSLPSGPHISEHDAEHIARAVRDCAA